MKTTLEFPDELFAQPKAAAAQRETTFRASGEHALRQEVGLLVGAGSPYAHYKIGPSGIPLIKNTGNTVVTSAMVRELLEEE
jgi:hypothetical protein